MHQGRVGTKDQLWLEPLFLIFYVLIQHYSGYIELSHFQAKTASVTAYTMLLDHDRSRRVSVVQPPGP